MARRVDKPKSSGRAAPPVEPTTGRDRAVAGARPSKTPTKAETAVPSIDRLRTELAALARERDALHGALTEAQARIADLERRQTEIANRIVWAIDTLHSLSDASD